MKNGFWGNVEKKEVFFCKKSQNFEFHHEWKKKQHGKLSCAKIIMVGKRLLNSGDSGIEREIFLR